MKINNEDVFNLLSSLSDDINMIKDSLGLSVVGRTDEQKWTAELKDMNKIITHKFKDDEKTIIQQFETKYQNKTFNSFQDYLCIEKGNETVENLAKEAMRILKNEISVFNKSSTKKWLINNGATPINMGRTRNIDNAKKYISFVIQEKGDASEIIFYLEHLYYISYFNPDIQEYLYNSDFNVLKE